MTAHELKAYLVIRNARDHVEFCRMFVSHKNQTEPKSCKNTTIRPDFKGVSSAQEVQVNCTSCALFCNLAGLEGLEPSECQSQSLSNHVLHHAIQ